MLTIGAKQSGTIKKYYIEAPTSVKQVILETSQNSQENTYAPVSFLIKLQRPATVLKKRPWHRCFPVNFAKYLRTFFFAKQLRITVSDCSKTSYKLWENISFIQHGSKKSEIGKNYFFSWIKTGSCNIYDIFRKSYARSTEMKVEIYYVSGRT